MANLITSYTNGTFEGEPETWDAQFEAGSTAQERDAVIFYEGAASLKMTTRASLGPQQFFTPDVEYYFICPFPAIQGEPVEVKVRLKVSEAMPGDVVFFIQPVWDTSSDHPGLIFPALASSARDGFIELRANFLPGIFNGNGSFFVAALFNSDEFRKGAEFYNPGVREGVSLLLSTNAKTPIPAGAFVWVDAMTAEAKAIPQDVDALNTQFIGRRLYYVKDVFYLQVGGTRTVIEEPIKWDDVQISVVWDKKSKAYRFEFSDKDVLLEFDNAAGREILREQYKLKGSNADAKLLFGELNTLTDELTIHYEGQINFGPGSAVDNETVFKCNIERVSLNDKLRVYFDTRVDVFRETSLGGLALAPMQTKDLFLHPRLLTFRADYLYNPRVDPNDAPLITQSDGHYKTAVPPFTYTNRTPGANNSVSNNVDGLREPSPPDGTLIYAGLELSPGITKRSFRFDNVRLAFSFTVLDGQPQEMRGGVMIYKRGNVSGSQGHEIENTPWTYEDRAAEGLAVISNTNFGINPGAKTWDGMISGNIDLFADEAIFIKAYLYAPLNNVFNIADFKFIKTEDWQMQIQEQTVYSPTLISAPRLHDVVNRQLEIILDTPNPLRSDFLGRIDLGYEAAGCGADHFAMNGKIIRQFKDRAFNLSIKDNYNTLDALFNMGMSIERDEDEVERVRLEEMPYFFRDVLLMDLKVISGYERRPADDYLFNEIKAKFKKYPRDNQQDSLEDFHTEMNYITPLKRVKNRLDITIDAILSGYYIEYTRQQAFNVNPSNAYETDEDLFLISSRAADAVFAGLAVVYDPAKKTIRINKVIPVVDGDYIKITTPAGGATNGIYKIDFSQIGFFFDHMVLTVPDALMEYTGPADVTITGADGQPVERFQAKRDEDFKTASFTSSGIQGVVQSKSVYNLEHHLKRVVMRWAKMFQSGWDFLFVGALPWSPEGITFTDGANNTGVVTELKEGVSCVYGGRYAADAGFHGINSMDRPLFGKDVVSFKAPLTWTAFNNLRKAYEGRHPEGKDYGFFQWTNPDGIIERGYNLGMKFNPNTQICTFNLILKFNGR